MNTITVTCPEDKEQFAVVEPENSSAHESLTATCPACSRQFAIVYPDELRESGTDSKLSKESYSELAGWIYDWETRSDPPSPYTGSDEQIPFEQYAIVKVFGMGKPRLPSEMETLDESELDLDRFQIWYTPEHQASDFGNIRYVVRADLETGVKTKNVYGVSSDREDARPRLYIKNRGVPRNSDKQWTYLDRAECYARAAQAGLSNDIVQDPNQDGRYIIFLSQEVQPLIDEKNELAEDLFLELAKMLIAFQTERTTH